MNTKERIAKEALTLFSERGYAATSVRDIAAAVGIKDSSLYNHYKSKQEIFDSVIESYTRMGAEKHLSFYKRNELPEGTLELFKDPKLIAKMGRGIFASVVADDDSKKLRRLLATEMYRSEQARKAYADYIREPFTWTEMLFSRLMDAGILVREDAAVLAYEFMAPISVLQTEYECGALSLDGALELMERHVTFFYGKYMTEAGK